MTASTIDAAIQKKIFEPAMMTLIILNEEMNDIMKKVMSLKDIGLLINGVGETNKDEAKEQKGWKGTNESWWRSNYNKGRHD